MSVIQNANDNKNHVLVLHILYIWVHFCICDYMRLLQAVTLLLTSPMTHTHCLPLYTCVPLY